MADASFPTGQTGERPNRGPAETAREALQIQFSPETIATMPAAQLLAIEIAPGFPESALAGPAIAFPAELMPAGSYQHRSKRTVDLIRALPKGMDADSPMAHLILLSMRRMLLLLWVVAYTSKRRAHSLPMPSTWVTWGQRLVLMVKWALSKHRRVDGRIFAHLNSKEMDEMMSKLKDAHTNCVYDRLTQFRHRELWNDWPDIAALGQGETENKEQERSRKGQESPLNQAASSRQWQPLPDQFVAEMGWRALWLIDKLGASLLDCFEECMAVTLPNESSAVSSQGVWKAINKRRLEIIKTWDWRTPEGEAITALPFSMNIEGRKVEAWPPQRFDLVLQAVSVLQGQNLFVGSLSMAGRASEVLSLRDPDRPDEDQFHSDTSKTTQIDIVEESEDDSEGGPERVEGRTYKLSQKIGGAERDWPIPPIAARAFKLQKHLARIFRPAGSDSLWVQLTAGGAGVGSPNNDANSMFQYLVKTLGLQSELGEDEHFHHHRCRKTIARLAGFALVGAPKILMDLFGQKTIEMALSYILSDPDFAAEVQEVAKAQIIILGKQAIESADKNGGPAAEGLRKGVAREKARRGEKAYHAQGEYEMAEILTLNGKACQVVRPGVICTKGPGEVGACAKGSARIDTSRCKEKCSHRLELAALRDDVDRSIAECARHLQKAIDEDEETSVEFWRGQLQHHLGRFPDLRDKWLAHPELSGLIASETEDAA